MKKIGILSLQGDYKKHMEWLRKNNLEPVSLKGNFPTNIDGLILPGGESSTIMGLLNKNKLFKEEIKNKITAGIPTLATCAGLIILSNKILNSPFEPLKVIDVTIQRNGYGPQYNSGTRKIFLLKSKNFIESVFIRAPKVETVGKEVEILGKINKEPVYLKQGNILGITFHPELTETKEVLLDFISLL